MHSLTLDLGNIPNSELKFIQDLLEVTTMEKDYILYTCFDLSTRLYTLSVRSEHLAVLQQLLKSALPENILATLRIKEVDADTNWLLENQKEMAIIHVGKISVYSSHHREIRDKSRINIDLDSGLAFGSGRHATTQGCILLLQQMALREEVEGKKIEAIEVEKIPQNIPSERSPLDAPLNAPLDAPFNIPGEIKSPANQRPTNQMHTRTISTILDLGTGSGILAIAAAKLFTTKLSTVKVDLIDNDQQALEVAVENCKRNGVTPRYQALALEPAREQAQPNYDLIIANILLNTLVDFAPLLQGYPLLLLSGIEHVQVASLLAAYKDYEVVEQLSILDDSLGQNILWTSLLLSLK